MRVILCQGVRDLKKQHYESHESDPMSQESRDLKKQHYVSHVSDPMSRSKRSEETTLRVTCK